MTTVGELWPSRDEYDLAVARWAETMLDPELRGGKLDYDHLGIRRYGGANLYVCIYKISDCMIRCFCSTNSRVPPADIRERYRAIAAFSEQSSGRVSALARLTYHDQGVIVGPRLMPLVKMPFFAGCPSLGEFITDHYHETAVMQQLCDAWLRMIIEMEAASMAHGDLDLSNVLVERRGPTLLLHLIDYDNTWIPALSGRSQTEHGHLHFQHPAFMPPNLRPFSADMDRFSALVIYISLRALVSQPQLYEQWGADESERLLFANTDYQNAGQPGNRIAQLRQLSAPDLYPYLDELQAALREQRMPRSLSVITTVTLPPSSPLDSYHPPAPPMQAPVGPPPPPRALWHQARYNPPSSFPFPSPPVQPQQSMPAPQPMVYRVPGPPSAPHMPPAASPGPSWGERTGVNPIFPTPGRPQGGRDPSSTVSREAANDAGRLAGPPVSMPPFSDPGLGNSGLSAPPLPPAGVSRLSYNSPSNPGLGNPGMVAPPPSPWNGASINNSNPGFDNINAAMPTPIVAPPIAAPPTPIPSLAANEDDTPRPLDFVQAGTKPAAPTGRRRLVIWLVIGLLIAIILGAVITLALLFIPGLHIGDTSNPGFANQEMLAPANVPNIPLRKTPTPPPSPSPEPPTPTPSPRPTLTPTMYVPPTPVNVPTATPVPTKIPTATPTPSPTAANNSGGFTGIDPFHPGSPPDPPSGSPFNDPLVYVLLGVIIAACAALVVIVRKTRILGK